MHTGGISFDFHYIVGLSICAGLNQTLELSEMTRQQLEEEIQALNREKGDIQEQLSSVSKQTSISRTHSNIMIMISSKRFDIKNMNLVITQFKNPLLPVLYMYFPTKKYQQ